MRIALLSFLLIAQTFAEDERPTALEALAARLSDVGIFIRHCNDEWFPPSSWQLPWAGAVTTS